MPVALDSAGEVVLDACCLVEDLLDAAREVLARAAGLCVNVVLIVS